MSDSTDPRFGPTRLVFAGLNKLRLTAISNEASGSGQRWILIHADEALGSPIAVVPDQVGLFPADGTWQIRGSREPSLDEVQAEIPPGGINVDDAVIEAAKAVKTPIALNGDQAIPRHLKAVKDDQAQVNVWETDSGIWACDSRLHGFLQGALVWVDASDLTEFDDGKPVLSGTGFITPVIAEFDPDHVVGMIQPIPVPEAELLPARWMPTKMDIRSVFIASRKVEASLGKGQKPIMVSEPDGISELRRTPRESEDLTEPQEMRWVTNADFAYLDTTGTWTPKMLDRGNKEQTWQISSANEWEPSEPKNPMTVDRIRQLFKAAGAAPLKDWVPLKPNEGVPVMSTEESQAVAGALFPAGDDVWVLFRWNYLSVIDPGGLLWYDPTSINRLNTGTINFIGRMAMATPAGVTELDPKQVNALIMPTSMRVDLPTPLHPEPLLQMQTPSLAENSDAAELGQKARRQALTQLVGHPAGDVAINEAKQL